MKQISIIVPIYNAEKHLKKCLDSLVRQTLIDIEIILINDGSKDNSLTICNDYAKKDTRIKVIDKSNEGVSIARNIGMNFATGTYVGFVDPDDWIEPEMYQIMYEKIVQTKSQICLCNYYKDDKTSSTAKLFRFKDEIFLKKDIINHLVTQMIGIDDIMPRYNYIMGSVWRCLYDRAFLDNYTLRFIKGISIMEDLVFSVEALLKSEKVCFDHGIRYHYVKNPNSVLHAYNKDMWKDEVRVHELLENILSSEGLEAEMRNRLDMRYIGMALAAMKNEINRKNKVDFKKRIQLVKDICADEKLKIALDRVKPIQRHMSDLDEKIEEKYQQRD